MHTKFIINAMIIEYKKHKYGVTKIVYERNQVGQSDQTSQWMV